MTAQITGVAAGVPFLAVPPDSGPSRSAPVVVGWHLMDPPRTEVAFAAALPLAGLDAWRIYLGLPLTGSRAPAGGDEEIMRLGYEDAVLNLYGPISRQAAAEFPSALAALRDRFGLGSGPVGLLGGSQGAEIAQLALLEGPVGVAALVLVSPVTQLRSIVEANAERYEMTYSWSASSDEVARWLDFVARAGETEWPATMLVVGSEDAAAIREPAAALREALGAGPGNGPAELVVVDGMGHELAEAPGLEPAPQTPHAVVVDDHAVRWFGNHLTTS